MNLYLSHSLFAQLFMLIVSYADAAPFAVSGLCLMCPYFHIAASAVSSKNLRYSISNSAKETVPTPLISVSQKLPKSQSVPKSVSASKSVRSTVPQHHGHRHRKGILTFEVNKMLHMESTTDLPKAQETEKSADDIRSTVETTTTTTEKPNRRAYDHNCFFTPMNCQMYLRV
ncbi:hypothetical protein DdX_06708 [Ditylenchus destructor]|uniref:Secreted protein n=1 Tax=Ditylenchus destructor TaxID=166010 RepID=A0AAD4NBC1_9BILA|nr:hypothetical protein DdX_06708 [Ditylenchus destructor]